MLSTRLARRLPALPAVVCFAAAAAMGQSFSGLGFLPGCTNSSAAAVSADGSVVVGASSGPSGNRAFRWTSAGMVNLGTLPGGTYSGAGGVSDDGSVVVGSSDGAAGTRAFRWTSAGMVDLGLPLDGGGDGEALNSYGNAVSGDGLVVVGMSDPINQGLRWSSAGGMLSLGTLGGSYSIAYGASFDGSVIVGESTVSDDNAFRWTLAGGMVSIGTLPGGTASHAFGVSADGGVIVGWSGTSGFTGARAFRWVAGPGGGTMTNLGVLPWRTASRAFGVSGDGLAVVGISGTIAAGDHAILWTPQLGMVDLNTYLPALGISVSGWTLTAANAISADGRTIVGRGQHGTATEGWVAHLRPCGSADFNGDGDIGTDADIEAFFACLAGHCCATCGTADFNGDGDLGTDADIESFFRVLAGGGC
jgi:probable HAF family extracellular repeat protein